MTGIAIRDLTLLASTDGVLDDEGIAQQLDEYMRGGHRIPDAGVADNSTILFVHVGKTGGETIQWRVKLSCKLRRSKLMKQECHQVFAGIEESALSKATIGYFHCDKLRPKWALENATMFMFSLRNPVDRIISWFQYMHPDNCIPNRPSAACNLKQDTNPWGSIFYKQCFPSINDFVFSMKTRMIRHSKNCSELALQTVKGEGPEGMHRGVSL